MFGSPADFYARRHSELERLFTDVTDVGWGYCLGGKRRGCAVAITWEYWRESALWASSVAFAS